VIRPGPVQGLIEADSGVERGRDGVPQRGLIEREGGGADPFSLEYGRVAGARGESWRGGRFAEVGEDGADRGWLREKRDQAHVALAAWAGERPELVAAGEQSGPVDRGAAASGRRECGIGHWHGHWCGLRHGLCGAGGDAGTQLGMRGEHAGVVMPVTPRRRNQCGEPVEQFEWGEGELGLGGGQGFGEDVAGRLVGPVPGEPFTGEGRASAVAQQPLEAGAVRGLDQDGGVQREATATGRSAMREDWPARRIGTIDRVSGVVEDLCRVARGSASVSCRRRPTLRCDGQGALRTVQRSADGTVRLRRDAHRQ